MRNPKKSSEWNPLSLLYNTYKRNNYGLYINELIDIATLIMSDNLGIRFQDPFWKMEAFFYWAGTNSVIVSNNRESD